LAESWLAQFDAAVTENAMTIVPLKDVTLSLDPSVTVIVSSRDIAQSTPPASTELIWLVLPAVMTAVRFASSGPEKRLPFCRHQSMSPSRESSIENFQGSSAPSDDPQELDFVVALIVNVPISVPGMPVSVQLACESAAQSPDARAHARREPWTVAEIRIV
jgi:hypothetical protein